MRIMGRLAATAMLLVFASSASAQVVVSPMEHPPSSTTPQINPNDQPTPIPEVKPTEVDPQGSVKHFPTVSVPEPGALVLTAAAVVWALGSWRRRGRDMGNDGTST